MDIDKMIKCRALYLQSIVSIIGENIEFDNSFSALLTVFAECYIEKYPDLFKIIYNYEIINNEIQFYEEDEWNDTLNWYLKRYFSSFDGIRQLYNEIGVEDVDKISRLAELFCEYLYEVNDINYNMRIKH